MPRVPRRQESAEPLIDREAERQSLEFLGLRQPGVRPEVYYRALADLIEHTRKLMNLGQIDQEED